MIITIDGPAGSGKSTASRELARALGIAYLDTGATYRAVTFRAISLGVDLADEAALADVARKIDLKLIPEPGGTRVLADGQDITAEIRTPEVTAQTHHAAGSPVVREVLVDMQRRLGADLGSFVAEGRDQGSVVFPDADVKFYLDASPQVRARRRKDYLEAAGLEADLDDTRRAILDRDRHDRGRQVAPLIRPEGAIVIDTSEMAIAETSAVLARAVRERT